MRTPGIDYNNNNPKEFSNSFLNDNASLYPPGLDLI